MVKVPFHLIRVNTSEGSLEIIFPYGNKWWKLDWDKVPDRFKHLYVVYLKLQGIEIPDHLKEYQVNTLSMDNIDISIDLDKCVQVPENYPLGV